MRRLRAWLSAATAIAIVAATVWLWRIYGLEWLGWLAAVLVALTLSVPLIRLIASGSPGKTEILPGRLRLLTESGHAPFVFDTTALDLGVAPAIGQSFEEMARLPAYVTRSIDKDVDWAVSRGGLVLLHGRAAAGKTRTAFEAARRVRGGYRMFVPSRPGALREIVDAKYEIRNTVIWLDDIERYLAPGGLDLELFEALCPPGRVDVVIVATIRDEVLERLERPSSMTGLPSDQLVQTSRSEVLDRANRYAVAQYLQTEWELQAAAAAAEHDSRIAEAMASDAGFAEYLSAGPAMMRIWWNTDSPEADVRQAIISAAVDCRRVEFSKPIPLSVLEELHRHYLSPARKKRSDLPPFRQGLEAACATVLGASSCIIPLPDNMFEPSTYLVDRCDAGEGPIGNSQVTDAALSAVLPLADPEEAFFVGRYAFHTNRLDIATTACESSAGRGNVDAMVMLGVILANGEDFTQAARWWGEAAALGEPVAMANLGRLHEDIEVDLVESQRWYRKAADRGDVAAMSGLGRVFREQGDIAQAEHWYRRAAERGNADAMTGLGLLLRDKGQSHQAERWYRRAAGMGDTDAMLALGRLLEEGQDPTQAEDWYRQAAQAGDTEAMVVLGVYCSKHGRPEDAKAWWHQAANAGDAAAMYNLGLTYLAAGRDRDAEVWWRMSAKEGAPEGALGVALLLHQRGQDGEASTWYRRAMEAGVDLASIPLGALLIEQREDAQAEALLRQTAEAGNAQAMFRLGELLSEQGDEDQAELWWTRSGSLGNSDSQTRLAELYHSRHEVAQAEALWLQAAEAGNAVAIMCLATMMRDRGDEAAARSWLDRATNVAEGKSLGILGSLYAEMGDEAQAERLWTKAAEDGDTEAMSRLGMLLVENEEPARGEFWLRRAAESGHTHSATKLAAYLHSRDDLVEAERWYRLAADSGDVGGMLGLCFFLHLRDKGEEAREWLRRAVEAGVDNRTRPLYELVVQHLGDDDLPFQER